MNKRIILIAFIIFISSSLAISKEVLKIHFGDNLIIGDLIVTSSISVWLKEDMLSKFGIKKINEREKFFKDKIISSQRDSQIYNYLNEKEYFNFSQTTLIEQERLCLIKRLKEEEEKHKKNNLDFFKEITTKEGIKSIKIFFQKELEHYRVIEKITNHPKERKAEILDYLETKNYWNLKELLKQNKKDLVEIIYEFEFRHKNNALFPENNELQCYLIQKSNKNKEKIKKQKAFQRVVQQINESGIFEYTYKKNRRLLNLLIKKGHTQDKIKEYFKREDYIEKYGDRIFPKTMNKHFSCRDSGIAKISNRDNREYVLSCLMHTQGQQNLSNLSNRFIQKYGDPDKKSSSSFGSGNQLTYHILDMDNNEFIDVYVRFYIKMARDTYYYSSIELGTSFMTKVVYKKLKDKAEAEISRKQYIESERRKTEQLIEEAF